MTTNEALANLRLAGLSQEAQHFDTLIRAHEKESAAAIGCLRQMDKIKAENERLKRSSTLHEAQ